MIPLRLISLFLGWILGLTPMGRYQQRSVVPGGNPGVPECLNTYLVPQLGVTGL